MGVAYSSVAFQRSTIQYAIGRLINAFAAFLILIWVAQQLSELHYANYITSFALLEVGLVLSNFGMEWVTAVFIPQAKLKVSGNTLRIFIWRCIAVQFGTLMIGAGVLFMAAPTLSDWLKLEGAVAALQVYAIVMFVEGMGRVFRDQILACLLLQAAGQISQMVRNIFMLIFVFLIFQKDAWRTAEGLAYAELFASTSSLIIAAIFLFQYLKSCRDDPASDPDWHLPSWSKMLRAGRNAWLSNLANMSWGGQTVILLVTRLIGVEATAPMGFARNLSEQIRRFMPMDFLLGVIRTLLVARFLEERSLSKLGIRVGLIFRINLLFLIPLIILLIIRGDEVCSILSGGRYESAHWFLIGWLGVLMAWAHHRLTDLMAHILERSGVTSRISILLCITPLFLYCAGRIQHWELLFFTLFIAESIYSYLVLRNLRTSGWQYRLYWLGLGKLSLLAIVALVIGSLFQMGEGIVSILLSMGIITLIMLIGVMLLKAWSPEEKSLLSGVVLK